MAARGVVFRLNTRISDAGPGLVVLSDGKIRAGTLVWTAGTAPESMLKSLALEKDKRGALVVDDTLAIPGIVGLWALGDCAAVVDAKTKSPARLPRSSRCARLERWQKTSANNCAAAHYRNSISIRSEPCASSDTKPHARN